MHLIIDNILVTQLVKLIDIIGDIICSYKTIPQSRLCIIN